MDNLGAMEADMDAMGGLIEEIGRLRKLAGAVISAWMKPRPNCSSIAGYSIQTLGEMEGPLKQLRAAVGDPPPTTAPDTSAEERVITVALEWNNAIKRWHYLAENGTNREYSACCDVFHEVEGKLEAAVDDLLRARQAPPGSAVAAGSGEESE